MSHYSTEALSERQVSGPRSQSETTGGGDSKPQGQPWTQVLAATSVVSHGCLRAGVSPVWAPHSSTVCCTGDGEALLPPLPLRKAHRGWPLIISLCPHPRPPPPPPAKELRRLEGGTREGRPCSKTPRRSLGGQGQAIPHCSAIPPSCLPLLRPQLPEGGQGLLKAALKRTFPSWER